jgi:hypothetical protein
MRRLLVPAAIALVALLAIPAVAAAAKVNLVGTFSGKAEAPTPGDPDGTGKAAITVDTKTREVCWAFTGVKNIAKPIAAHIHKAKKGSAGPIVVDFSMPKYKSKGCVTTTKALAKDIAANPASYYANIHTSDFPGGAIRAQLKAAPKTK